MKKLKVLFMGTPDFAVPTLEALCNSEYEVIEVVTQPDKPKGRGKSVQMTPVKECALKYDIPVYQPGRLRNEESVAHLAELDIDFMVVVAFGQILPKSVLDMPRYGCINVHSSLLPAYRGAAPMQWTIINGETKTGVTTMYMDEGIDTGDILPFSSFARYINILPCLSLLNTKLPVSFVSVFNRYFILQPLLIY